MLCSLWTNSTIDNAEVTYQSDSENSLLGHKILFKILQALNQHYYVMQMDAAIQCKCILYLLP